MSTNNSKKDTHIYNIINNPPKEFTEPCECCGVSEFQLGVKHATERIIALLEMPYWHNIQSPDTHIDCAMCRTIELIKGEK